MGGKLPPPGVAHPLAAPPPQLCRRRRRRLLQVRNITNSCPAPQPEPPQPPIESHALDLSSSTVASSVLSREPSPERERPEFAHLRAPGAPSSARSMSLRVAALRGAAGLPVDSSGYMSGLIVPLSSDGEEEDEEDEGEGEKEGDAEEA